MRTDIRIRKLGQSASLHRFAEKRLQARLGRFASEVTLVSLRLEDVNGPKGGEDMRCQIVVRGPRLRDMSVESLKATPRSAIDESLQRTATSIARALARQRVRSTRGPSIRTAA